MGLADFLRILDGVMVVVVVMMVAGMEVRLAEMPWRMQMAAPLKQVQTGAQ